MGKSKKKKQAVKGKRALELVDEAFHLLRTAQPGILVLYYIGAVPFILGLMHFWLEMGRSALAYDKCVIASLRLTVLFVWMKVWQTFFADGLMCRISNTHPEKLTVERVLRVIFIQGIIQPLGLVLIPVSMVAGFIFGSTHAFFHNMSIIGNGSEPGINSSIRKARSLASLWPGQNHVMMWMISPWMLGLALSLGFGIVGWTAHSSGLTGEFPELGFMITAMMLIFVSYAMLPMCPFGFAVAGNISFALIAIPMGLKSILGIETLVSMNLFGSVFNTAFPVVVFGLSYLCLDPVVRAAYVIRCFHGTSVTTGEDLKAELRSIRVRSGAIMTVLLAACLLSATSAFAESEPMPVTASAEYAVDADELDEAITEVLERPEFSWRAPRERDEVVKETESSFFRLFLEKIGDALERVFKWMDRLLQKVHDWFRSRFNNEYEAERDVSTPWDWHGRIKTLFFIVLAGTACLLAILLYRMWRRRTRPSSQPAEAKPVMVKPDIRDENTIADELPADEWTAMAVDLLKQGELRLALRAFHMSCLARLALDERITIARCKSNRDYKYELDRKAHDQPETIAAFAENVLLLERTWYGNHPVIKHSLDTFIDNTSIITGVPIANYIPAATGDMS